MNEQREKARKARKTTNYMGADATVYDKIDPAITSEFVGYDKLSNDSKVTVLTTEEDVVEALSEGDKGTVIVDQTVFYATMGGQEGDKGYITTSEGEFKVDTTIKLKGGKIGHVGTMTKGMLKAGDTVTLTVDSEYRADTCKNHRPTHILQKALRTVLGDHVEQKTASTYQIEVRSEVVASVVPADGKEIKEVRVNEEQMDLADGTVTFSMPEKDSLLQVILKEKEQAAEETEEPKQEVTQTEEWELPDEKEYQQRLQLAKALGMEDWLDEEGWLDDGYFAGKSDLELTESGVVPLIRNSITNPKMSRAVTLYNKITYNNISSAEFAVDGKLAFCLEYAKTTPPAGTATGTPTEITNSGVKAAMYYGYTGPAAAQYNFSSTSQAVLVTATLSSYYYSGQSPFSSATSGNAQSTGFTAFYNFVEAHKASVPSSFKAYAVSTGSNTQHLGYWTYAPTGTMYLKTSANTAMTDNNSCYSLGNAVYGVYSNSACTTKVKVGTLTTGTNGVSNPISVNEGTYYRSTI